MSNRRAKILATLGTSASASDLLAAGADGLRVNTSHLTPEQAKAVYVELEALRENTDKPWSLLVDLQGPKLRFAKGEPFPLLVADHITLVEEGLQGDLNTVWVSIPNFARQVHVGDTVICGDGQPVLVIESIDIASGFVICRVTGAGVIRSRMGVTVPGRFKDVKALTDLDRDHLRVAAPYADWVAMSFVADGADMSSLREEMQTLGSSAWVMAKVERMEAVDNIDEICQHSDGIMVARGDLALQSGLALCAILQRQIIKAASHHGLPCVVATQVLESMVLSSQPTRAEAADIVHALEDGASTLMLSAETALGLYPLESVSVMSAIITDSEDYLTWQAVDVPLGSDVRARLVRAADQMAADSAIDALVIPTDSGHTPRWASVLSRQRDLITLCTQPQRARCLALVRGVRPYNWDGDHGIVFPVTVTQLAEEHGALSHGQAVVVCWVENLSSHPAQLLASLNTT